MEFEQYVWSSGPQPHQMDHTLIDDLFFGTFPDGPSLPHTAAEEDTAAGQRIRRVTLTELTDEDTDEDEWLMVSDESGSDNEECMGSDEIFKALDDAVQDWKIKLEVVIGEGLKKLRKSTKDNKMKMKYLPGESCGNKRLSSAKNAIVKDWTDEFDSAVRGVQTKLDKLAREKLSEVNTLCQDKLMAKAAGGAKLSPKKTKFESRKKIIDCREPSKKPGNNGSNNYGALKQMVRELDRMVAATTQTNFDLNCVPIYNMNVNGGCSSNANIVATPYEFPIQKYLKYLKEQQQQNTGVGAPQQNPKPKVDISQFVANNQPEVAPKVIPAVKQPVKVMKKEVKRETSAVLRREKMKERRQRRKKGEATITNKGTGFTYRLRQYSVNGEEHTLIVRKKIPTEQEEVEDIFKQWSHNLDLERKAKRAARVRKLSHRAQRKEFLREHSYPQVTGPSSYADALKKNLKYRPNYIPAEDVFEAWRDCLTEQEDFSQAAESLKAAKPCGQPTVKVPTVAAAAGIKRRRRHRIQPENYFAGWRFNLDDVEFLPKRLPKLGRNYQAEEYFRDWKKNLYVKEAPYPKKFRPLEKLPENIFNDWLHNFNIHVGGGQRSLALKSPRHPRKQPNLSLSEAAAEATPGDSLANKSRSNNQRRSKNKKGKQN